ncbi:hypothetical protein H0H81_005179 [Sphagnurus paluster]|uniref:Uncharacterized protein n=1 Tax=Sphagnurus paluster TaxID=117069 RepID=A0A9P7FQZ2_9AGAR|nr:hypothetical protein H0H81_005179 [Sphagnurus paluster]
MPKQPQVKKAKFLTVEWLNASKNIGIEETDQQKLFMKSLAPIYKCAAQENKTDVFYKLLFPIWFDRFPIILNDGFDDDALHIKWAQGRKELREEYMAMAQLGVLLEGHEFDAVITPAECTKAKRLIADDKETADFFKMLIDDIEEHELANQVAKGKVAEVDNWYFSYV